MKKRREVFFLTLFLVLSGFFLIEAVPTFALDYIPLEPIPGTSGSSNFPDYISGIYKFALWSVGIAAMFMLTVGGAMYLTSAGNTSAMGNAKNVIIDSLIGLVLALTAWFILNFINPDILTGDLSIFNTMRMEEIPTDTPESIRQGASTNPTGSKACSDCVEIPSDIRNKGCTPPASGYTVQSCKLNRDLLAKIQKIDSEITGWRITESYPPTVIHKSKCHLNGTCADINNSGGSTAPSNIKKYYDAFKAAGLNVLYESKDCTKYKEAGIDNCASYPTMTNGSSFHVS
jgi:hypothetical protein